MREALGSPKTAEAATSFDHVLGFRPLSTAWLSFCPSGSPCTGVFGSSGVPRSPAWTFKVACPRCPLHTQTCVANDRLVPTVPQSCPGHIPKAYTKYHKVVKATFLRAYTKYHKVVKVAFLRTSTKYHKVVKATFSGLDEVPLSCQGRFPDRAFGGFHHGPKHPKKEEEEEEEEEEELDVEPLLPLYHIFSSFPTVWLIVGIYFTKCHYCFAGTQ